jgi:hypothetical protein
MPADLIDYPTWKADFLADIESATNAVEKGDRFVQRILRECYQLSEDDAVDATECAGGGDSGADAIIITDFLDESQPPNAFILQGKYATAGEALAPLPEFAKFANALRKALNGNPPTVALEKCANVVRSGGTIQYVVATVDPLSDAQQSDLENARALAHDRFGDAVSIEPVNLEQIHRDISNRPSPGLIVDLRCQGSSPAPNLYVGTASLVEMYLMLLQYAQANSGVVDGIYDRNVRKWLGRAKAVNAGIEKTLREEPANFVAFNNGMTMVCRGFSPSDGALSIDTPQIVNGC